MTNPFIKFFKGIGTGLFMSVVLPGALINMYRYLKGGAGGNGTGVGVGLLFLVGGFSIFVILAGSVIGTGLLSLLGVPWFLGLPACYFGGWIVLGAYQGVLAAD